MKELRGSQKRKINESEDGSEDNIYKMQHRETKGWKIWKRDWATWTIISYPSNLEFQSEKEKMEKIQYPNKKWLSIF